MKMLKMHKRHITVFAIVSLHLLGCSQTQNTINTNNAAQADHTISSIHLREDNNINEHADFFERTMNAAPFLPHDQNTKHIVCDLPQASTSTHTTSTDANYNDYKWEQRIAHDWSFFSAGPEQGRILLIDIKKQNSQPAYRYLANSNTQNEIYEPWSSSKIFAFTGAIAKLRSLYMNQHENQNNNATYKNSGHDSKQTIKQNASDSNFEQDKLKIAQGRIGQHHIADMITSINSYEAFFKADGNSNALATFFANLASRDYLSSLFYDEWLKLSTPNIYFKGAYGPTSFEPTEFIWHGQDSADSMAFSMNNVAVDDPAYLPYRCEACGLTGNKPMTTLAQAEWLKRLAMHDEDPQTAHPYITQDDVDTLFYGVGHSQQSEQFAGMTLGVSTMLQQAIAGAIANTTMTPTRAKDILDRSTNGQWRVFQKIGWGPSETRSSTENVVLAHVCLPHYKGGRAFVVAAQVAVPEAKEENVALAGEKMQALLNSALLQYLATY